MGNKLYVGNLPYSFRDQDLEQTFGQFGAVQSAKVMMERDTGRSKGFGFVRDGQRCRSTGRHPGRAWPEFRRP